MPETIEQLGDFRTRALAWLQANAKPKPQLAGSEWGSGSDSMALFQNMTRDEERAHIDAVRAWIHKKDDAGFANLTWPREWGGQGLPPSYELAFSELENGFATPPGHEAVGITISLIAPTIRTVGTEEQRTRFLAPMLRTDEMWCQLFSEPGAGSDLANLSTRAVREADEWVISGQKVWTSGAQFADWGYALCRTDPAAPKHRGLTAFLLPMTASGVEVRPLRQATGGTSFNEVFFTDVRIPDSNRLGAVGDGWRVALTTLGFERGSASLADGGMYMNRLIALAQHLGRDTDPHVRQHIARAYSYQRAGDLTIERANSRMRNGAPPGPEGSLGKLLWTECLQLINTTVAAILGPRLVADTGEWGTYTWSEHLVGTAGYRIAAGSDEVQRNIIAERVLGLPGDARADKEIPWSQTLHG